MAKEHRGNRKATSVDRGGARAAHFAAGRTLAEWRGRAVTMGDQKHRANKQACRGRVAV